MLQLAARTILLSFFLFNMETHAVSEEMRSTWLEPFLEMLPAEDKIEAHSIILTSKLDDILQQRILWETWPVESNNISAACS